LNLILGKRVECDVVAECEYDCVLVEECHYVGHGVAVGRDVPANNFHPNKRNENNNEILLVGKVKYCSGCGIDDEQSYSELGIQGVDLVEAVLQHSDVLS
jgi:hypothetical protein